MAFNTLKKVSTLFTSELQRVSNELIVARGHSNFEETVTNKLRDITLFSAKLRFLRAKDIGSLTPQITAQESSYTTLYNYGDTVVAHLIEQQLAKSFMQTHAVKKLITDLDSTLEPEMIERKAQIMKAISQYKSQEDKVRSFDASLREREEEEAKARRQWDTEMAWMRDTKRQSSASAMSNQTLGHNYEQLRHLCLKLQLMAWLSTKLCLSPCGYDWLNDPENRLNLLKMARKSYTIHSFLNGNF